MRYQLTIDSIGSVWARFSDETGAVVTAQVERQAWRDLGSPGVIAVIVEDDE